ncbi:hypothetical protein [uncultured Selenomonas sp.]|uniref:hypothetical protein n=1 Tax=uncultured Selenomonas sp. TaxID=159275 RepID=UPI0025CF07D4|nr:hypothetical protein [uncultured Selenomonas sp.]
MRFDRDKIKKAGHPDTVICVVTNPADHAAFAFPTGGNVKAGKDDVAHRAAVLQETEATVPQVRKHSNHHRKEQHHVIP